MDVCLTTALSLADFIDPKTTRQAIRELDPVPQLGALSLSAVARARGFAPHLINLNQVFLDFIDLEVELEDPAFVPFVLRHLETVPAEVFGFSTLGSSYALTLRIAERLRRLRPDAVILLGGPQASVTDRPTLEAFPCIDIVVRGEAEKTFPDLLEILAERRSPAELSRLPGITYRCGSEVVSNPAAPVIANLDALPLPAYDLDVDLDERQQFRLEAGRGCPYNCTFCSTSAFFQRRFRMKSSRTLVSQMETIAERYGVSSFAFVHDEFTVDRRWVADFCGELERSNYDFQWTCSGRADHADEGLLRRMAEVGCDGIFFGIEVGSERMQKVIRKNLDLDSSADRIRVADELGITTGVSLMTAFPEETKDDLRATVSFFIDSSRYDHAEPRLALLAPMPGSPLHIRYRDQLVLDGIFSVVANQSWRQDDAEVELIKKHPTVFPNFYAIPTSHLPRTYLAELRSFITNVTLWFRWLPIAHERIRGDFVDIFDRWREWRGVSESWTPRRPLGAGDKVPYYCSREFADDYLLFARKDCSRQAPWARRTIGALIASEGSILGLPARAADAWPEARPLPELYPYRPDSVALARVEVEYTELLRRLREKEDLEGVPARNVTLSLIRIEEKRIDVRQLTDLSAELLELCDGDRSVADIVATFEERRLTTGGIPAAMVCDFGLRQLQRQELLRFDVVSRSAGRATSDRSPGRASATRA